MNSQQKTKALVSFVLTLIAVGLHTYLALKFYDLKFGNMSEPSLCNINAVFNCDAVSSSHYASFLGIPMALWGAVTNLIFLFFQTVTLLGWTENSRQTQVFNFIMSTFIALASVMMGLISLLFLKQFCVFCMAAYILSWTVFAMWWLATSPRKPGEIAEVFREMIGRAKWILWTVAAIPVLAFIFNSMLIDRHDGREIEGLVVEKYNQWTNASPQKFDDGTGLVLDASPQTPKKMVVIEFADFLCPHCRAASQPLNSFTQSHPDVKFIFKTFPLDGTCNPDPVFQGHGDGIRCRLALATFCSEKLFQKGWAVHDYIFDEQESFHEIASKDAVDKNICDKFGFKCDELKACMDSPDSTHLIQTMATEGSAAKIQGTPTVFVNNKLLNQGQFLPVMREVYDQIPSP